MEEDEKKETKEVDPKLDVKTETVDDQSVLWMECLLECFCAG